MSLQRYEEYYGGVEKDPAGEYVRLEDVVKLLEARASDLLGHDGSECDCKVQGEECLVIIELIKGENK